MVDRLPDELSVADNGLCVAAFAKSSAIKLDDVQEQESRHERGSLDSLLAGNKAAQ